VSRQRCLCSSIVAVEEVVDKRRLGTGVGLGDDVAELALVLIGAAVKGVVLPVAVKDVPGVQLVVVEGQLLEQLITAPAGANTTPCCSS
jgi:hypothetical protein